MLKESLIKSVKKRGMSDSIHVYSNHQDYLLYLNTMKKKELHLGGLQIKTRKMGNLFFKMKSKTKSLRWRNGETKEQRHERGTFTSLTLHLNLTWQHDFI